MDSQFWNEKFTLTPNLYGDAPNKFFEKTLLKLKTGKILLPGEGEGRNALFAASKGWKVLALDQSPIAQKHTLEKARKNGLDIDYRVCSIEKFVHKQKKFDVVALIYFHLPIHLRAQVHGKFEEMIKENGVLIIEGFGKDQLKFTSGGPKNIEMLYAIEEIKSDFPSFKWEYEFEGIDNLNEGVGHSGKAHLVRLIGRKLSD